MWWCRFSSIATGVSIVGEQSIDSPEPDDEFDETDDDAEGSDIPDELLDVDDEDDDVALVQLHVFDEDAIDSAAEDNEVVSVGDIVMLLDMAVSGCSLFPSWLPIR